MHRGRRSRRRSKPTASRCSALTTCAHRRISLLRLAGMPWARIGEFVGQRNLAVTANRYTHVTDEAELDNEKLLAVA
jgi:hypothetical protein